MEITHRVENEILIIAINDTVVECLKDLAL